MAIISIKNVSKSYGRKEILKNVSFDIEEGKIFGLLGSNGAGKSTITKIILQLEKQSSGEIVYFDGEDVNLKKAIAIVPQDIAFYKNFSVKKNMLFFASIGGLKGKDKEKRSKFILDWLELSAFENVEAGFLSGGYQRLLNIAIALLQDPEIIFLDEPTVGLDPKMRKLFWSKITSLKKEGKTVILTTHYMDEAETLCDKVILLKKGKIIEMGSPKELIFKYGGIQVMIFKIENGINDADVEKIKKVFDEGEVVSKGDLLFIPVEKEHGYEKTVAITHWLMEKGYNIKLSTTKQPNLEDVFIKITGEKMKGGEE